MECFCLRCKKEKEMVIINKEINDKEIKYIGECIECGNYLCRIFLKE